MHRRLLQTVAMRTQITPPLHRSSAAIANAKLAAQSFDVCRKPPKLMRRRPPDHRLRLNPSFPHKTEQRLPFHTRRRRIAMLQHIPRPDAQLRRLTGGGVVLHRALWTKARAAVAYGAAKWTDLLRLEAVADAARLGVIG